MLFAYVDESGDPAGDPAQRGSPAYTLGVVLVRGDDWVDAFDGLIALRRELSQNLGVPARAEVKASYLIRNEGPFETLGLSANQRRYIYRRHMAILSSLRARAFAVFVDKQALAARGRLQETRELVWETSFSD